MARFATKTGYSVYTDDPPRESMHFGGILYLLLLPKLFMFYHSLIFLSPLSILQSFFSLVIPHIHSRRSMARHACFQPDARWPLLGNCTKLKFRNMYNTIYIYMYTLFLFFSQYNIYIFRYKHVLLFTPIDLPLPQQRQ